MVNVNVDLSLCTYTHTKITIFEISSCGRQRQDQKSKKCAPCSIRRIFPRNLKLRIPRHVYQFSKLLARVVSKFLLVKTWFVWRMMWWEQFAKKGDAMTEWCCRRRRQRRRRGKGADGAGEKARYFLLGHSSREVRKDMVPRYQWRCKDTNGGAERILKKQYLQKGIW